MAKNPFLHLPLKRRVRVYLAAEGLTQHRLAKQIGIHPSRLSIILSGQAEATPAETVALERVTGIPAREFLDMAS